MYTVLVRGLEFYAFHGVSNEEQTIGHRYRVDLELEVDGRADQSDDVSDSVDYGAVATRVVAIGRESRHRTVERVARLIAEELLLDHPRIAQVTMTLVKRLPPAAVIAEEAGVRLVVKRS